MTNLTQPRARGRRVLSTIAVGLLATAVVATGSLAASPAVADSTPRPTTILPGGGSHPVGVAFSPDGTTAWVADQNTFLRTYNVADNSFVSEISVFGPQASNCTLSDVAVTSTGSKLYVPGWNCTGGSKLLRFTPGSTAQPNQIALKSNPSDIAPSVTGAVAITPDDSAVLVFAETNQTPSRSALFVFTTSTSAVRSIDLGAVTTSGQSPSDIVISSDSSTAWVTTRSGTVARVALGTDEVTQIPVEGNARGLALSEPADAVVAVMDTGKAQAISLSQNLPDTPESISDSPLDGVDISADGVTMVIVGQAGSSAGGQAWVLDDVGIVSYALGSTPWDVAIDTSRTQAYSPNWGSGNTDIIPLTDSAPVFIADVAPTTATVGKSYGAQFTASGNPAPTYSATGTLPTGLTLDATTGLLTGKPTTGGTFTFQVVASNGVLPAATGATHTVKVLKVLKTSTPTISGTKKVGKKLTAKKSSWSPAPVSYKYQWYRSSKGSYVKIGKATKSTYTLTKSDKGHKIRVVLTGSKSGYVTVSKTSKSSTIK